MLDVARHSRPVVGAMLALAIICGASLTVACASYGLHFSGLLRVLFPDLLSGGHTCYAPVRTSKMRVRATEDAILQFVIERGVCPSGVDQLLSEKYLDRDKVRDPWGNRLFTNCFFVGDEAAIIVRAAGPDGQFGTADDVIDGELPKTPASALATGPGS